MAPHLHSTQPNMTWEGTNFSFQPADDHLGPKHVAVNNTDCLLAVFATSIITSTKAKYFLLSDATLHVPCVV